MRFILDTHILLWAIIDDAQLPASVRACILDPHNDPFFSTASIWEIAIKRTLRREALPISSAEALRLFRDAGFEELPVRSEHAAEVERLPLLHNDPFDRLLVAQARIEPMRLITHDRLIASYGPEVWLV